MLFYTLSPLIFIRDEERKLEKRQLIFVKYLLEKARKIICFKVHSLLNKHPYAGIIKVTRALFQTDTLRHRNQLILVFIL